MRGTALGAYGREANHTDWTAGKDFRFYGGPYFSIRDVDALKDKGYTEIQFCDIEGFILFIVEL